MESEDQKSDIRNDCERERKTEEEIKEWQKQVRIRELEVREEGVREG